MLGSAKPSRGRYRSGRHRPTFDTPIVLRRLGNALKHQRGTQDLDAEVVYAVKAAYDRPAAPSAAPPADHGAAPIESNGWKGYWPTPPSPLPAGYIIPDPPEGEPPVETTQASPVLWRIEAEIGGAAWSAPEIFEIRLKADVKTRSGSERDQAGELVAATSTSFRLQRANVGRITADPESLPTEWQIRLNGHAWNIRSAISDWTGAYIDLFADTRR